VIASDLPVLREVGGSAAEYCPAGSVAPWVHRALELLHERRHARDRWIDRQKAGVVHARRFTWTAFAARLAQVYREVAAEANPMLARTPA
jgi:glycosyltransferase involved in cell wall biosynthesis